MLFCSKYCLQDLHSDLFISKTALKVTLKYNIACKTLWLAQQYITFKHFNIRIAAPKIKAQ